VLATDNPNRHKADHRSQKVYTVLKRALNCTVNECCISPKWHSKFTSLIGQSLNYFLYLYLAVITNFVLQYYFGNPKVAAASKGSEIHFRFRKMSPLACILSHLNSVHIFTPYFFQIYFGITFIFNPTSFSLFLLGLQAKIYMRFLFPLYCLVYIQWRRFVNPILNFWISSKASNLVTSWLTVSCWRRALFQCIC
jgi:hypothetical protein